MVGVEIARALSMQQVIVPPAPGVFSAVGLLFSPSEHEFVKTLLVRADEADSASISAAYESLVAEARASLERDGSAASAATFTRLADLRYVGQAYELSIPVQAGTIELQKLVHDFVAEHERTYGHGSLDDPVDIVSIRILARVERGPESVTLLHEGTRSGDGVIGMRDAYFGPDVGLLEVPIMTRSALADMDCEGPLFVDEYDSTTVVPPGCRVTLDASGSISIDVN